MRKNRSPRRSTSASRRSCASSKNRCACWSSPAPATRDYQFLRTILVREMDKKRAEVSIYLQLPPGVTERRGGIVQDVPPERLLGSFPTHFEAAGQGRQAVCTGSVRRRSSPSIRTGRS